ncbi:MAG: tRNA 4-thiouridine(8) synthase ThiI [Desulfobacteraceae bacterium]|nr:tRNA 4-thiouridine(8) synthase ThiI [Desulfobacteraceae bacterium]MCB9494662.1 tRNA 4-thiouridine(8) synthase ThiI [Desulfobacteraceae bacterium]
MENKNITALGISSGGLDSILSAFVLIDAGINVKWITFETPFFSAEKSIAASRRYNIDLRVENITDVYLEMLKNPRLGYGKNMNPCLDCHSLMFKIAGSLMKEEGADFLFSGEVVGQRPMSQSKNSLKYVEKNSGMRGYIVRPLSGRLLLETIPEKNGWIKREDLLDLRGRSRKPQLELAKKYNITDFPAPAGGCLLTDRLFCRRLKDLMDFQKIIKIEDYELLNYGRHIRISPFEKLVVGRNEKENNKLDEIASKIDCIKIKAADYPGPLCILRGNGDNMFTAGAICAGYTKAPMDYPCNIMFERSGNELLKGIFPIAKSEIQDMII